MKTNIKFLTIVTFFCVIAPTLNAQKNNYKQKDPISRVASMTEKHFLIDTSREPGEQIILSHYYISSFDDNGNRVEDLEFDSKDKQLKKYKYSYTGDQRDTLIITDSEAKLMRTIIYSYDDNGLLANDQSYDANGKPEKQFVYKYDEEGVLREDYSYLNSGEFNMKFTYTYDYKGNIDRNFRFSADGNLKEVRHYKYDENNNIVSEIVKNDAGDTLKSTVYQYVYDKKNNWVEKTIIIDNQPVKLIKRKLTY
ncbi:MAG: hypothetical protein KJ578_09840 [Bacteroidetes bacterium]|nr:hypothetical protein [Bacteroidota bacterium]